MSSIRSCVVATMALLCSCSPSTGGPNATTEGGHGGAGGSGGAPGQPEPSSRPPATTLEPGDTGPEVEALVGYLSFYGYFPSERLVDFPGWIPPVKELPADATLYDSIVGQAVSAYQLAQGLPVTGAVDAATLALMNVPRCSFPDNVIPTATAALPQPGAYMLQGSKWPQCSISYNFLNATPDLPEKLAKDTVTYAFSQWAAHSQLVFTELPMNGDLRIGWYTKDHGDHGNSTEPHKWDFDGPGKTLAHGFFPPASPFANDIAGDVHFDDDELWTLDGSSGANLGTVALHEIGHSIGLSHSPIKDAIMYASSTGIPQPLHPDDIAAIQALYPPFNSTGEDLDIAITGSIRVRGDFNGDGFDDLSFLYNYGNDATVLWVSYSTPNGGSLTAPDWKWASGWGNWRWENSKQFSGDFNHDGLADVGVLYNYGNDNTALWVLYSTGSGFNAPDLAWSSGEGNWRWENSKLISGDFDGDGYSDMGILYDYGNDTTALWVFYAGASGFGPPKFKWDSGVGNWRWANSKPISGDFDNDGNSDMAILYDYGNDQTNLWVFYSNGAEFGPNKLGWGSVGWGQWNWGKSKLVAGDFNGDSLDDVGILYGAPNDPVQLWVLVSKGGSGGDFEAPKLMWSSGPCGLAWGNIKPAAGDFNNDGIADVAMLYNTLTQTTGLWILYSTPGGFQPAPVWASGVSEDGKGNWTWENSKLQ